MRRFVFVFALMFVAGSFAAGAQQNSSGAAPLATKPAAKEQKTKDSSDGSNAKAVRGNKDKAPVLVAGGPLPDCNNAIQAPMCTPPPPPCSCSCFSVFSTIYWSCTFGGGACCGNDAGGGGGGSPAPVNAEVRPDPMKNAETAEGKFTAVADTKCSGVAPAPLGNATVVLAPERVAKLLARLSLEIKPDAVAGLRALLPVNGSSLMATPEVRAGIENYVVQNLKTPVVVVDGM